MTSPSERPYLSIGEVLELLKAEYPDLSISRIRALEASGLLELERTPSGYRKFYDADVEYLRTVLAGRPNPQLRENRAAARRRQDQLGSSRRDLAGDDLGADGADGADGVAEHLDELPGDPELRHPASFSSGRGRTPRSATNHRPAGPSAEHRAERTDAPAPSNGPDQGVVDLGTDPTSPPVLSLVEPLGQKVAVPGGGAVTGVVGGVVGGASANVDVPTAQAVDGPFGSRNPLLAGASGVSMSLDELCSATGVSVETVRELESLGLLKGQGVFSSVYYDEDALLTCRLVASFQQYGVEPRHLRMYKLAADREASFFEQVVTPQLRRRNPDARERAIETLGELVRLGEQLRVVALRQVLRSAVER
jgi:DNA-binding transcriptional MerR regulator